MKEVKIAGGQAVIEGVMMMSGNRINTSVRKGNKIISKRKRLKKRNRFYKFYFIRGVVNLVDMLKIGMESLIWSADQHVEKDEKLTKKEVIFSLLFSAAFAVLLFVFI